MKTALNTKLLFALSLSLSSALAQTPPIPASKSTTPQTTSASDSDAPTAEEIAARLTGGIGSGRYDRIQQIEDTLNRQLPATVRRGDVERIYLPRRFYVDRLVLTVAAPLLSSDGRIDVMADGITKATIQVDGRRRSHIVTVNDYAREITIRHLDGKGVKVKRMLLMYTDRGGFGFPGIGSSLGRPTSGSIGGHSGVRRCASASDDAGYLLNDVADLLDVLRQIGTAQDLAQHFDGIKNAYIQAVIDYEFGGILRARASFEILSVKMEAAKPWFQKLVNAPVTEDIGEDALLVTQMLKRLLSP